MTKTTLKELIKIRKFDWVNPSITSEVFPDEEIRGNDYKLFHFDRDISSEDAVKEMEKEGYFATNIFEFLSWDGWNGKDFVVALGSVGKVGGGRRVPGLVKDGSECDLYLSWWVLGWSSFYRFLAVRNSQSSDTRSSESALEPLVTLTLTQAEHKALKSALQKLMK